MISALLAPFRNLRVNVEIDPLLLPFLKCPDKLSLTRPITVNLFKLIYTIGTIQTRRFAPSRRQKFTDKSDLLEAVDTAGGDFKVRISNVQITLGSEILKTLSEDFGVGLSVIIAANLFHIKDSTIQRIYSHDKRPDWQCQTKGNDLLVVESKGASSDTTSERQRLNAVRQKGTRVADIRVASLTVIREHAPSSTKFVDPPVNEPNMNVELQRQILRAGHYASVFSFLGHSEFSRYYSKMRKRIISTISKREQLQKDQMFFKIRDDYSHVNFKDNEYLGKFSEIISGQYLFVGVDENLISYQGFLTFEDHKEDLEEERDNNHYMRFKDGILVIEIKNIQRFSNDVIVPLISNYQMQTTITDIDAMTEISFMKYWTYVLAQNNFQIMTEVANSQGRADFVAFFEDQFYVFELKLLKNRKLNRSQAEKIVNTVVNIEADYRVLVTNANIPIENIYDLGVIIIGRDQLKAIVQNEKHLSVLLNI
ncbi:PD-(D/E)XK nuclease domain-containing protein [Daejeonella lutea]|uniref:PD-(D/E)XK nuclease superfamily protein n=1 Tax=Daejeonella lutea TaxID=572036 RepID=A0A1T5B1E3_9SPHI|nr:PD-(D/E)XK nuclease domain-containing protein [Daejeonella lutea]SKB41034.1 PD-(D/E)XK nuclease superfamily protein [Daejeonella lutea]